MSNWHDSGDGVKRFCESHRKPKGGFMVKIGWLALETFGEKIAKKLGDRKEAKKKALAEARKKAHR